MKYKLLHTKDSKGWACMGVAFYYYGEFEGEIKSKYARYPNGDKPVTGETIRCDTCKKELSIEEVNNLDRVYISDENLEQ